MKKKKKKKTYLIIWVRNGGNKVQNDQKRVRNHYNCTKWPGPEVIKSFVMLNSAEHKICHANNPASILRKSTSGRHRPVSYPDGPMTARYRFT